MCDDLFRFITPCRSRVLRAHHDAAHVFQRQQLCHVSARDQRAAYGNFVLGQRIPPQLAEAVWKLRGAAGCCAILVW
ncbi:MAG: hypothetical protein WAT09_16815 [Paracoccaceae bacterium]